MYVSDQGQGIEATPDMHHVNGADLLGPQAARTDAGPYGHETEPGVTEAYAQVAHDAGEYLMTIREQHRDLSGHQELQREAPQRPISLFARIFGIGG